MVNVCQEAESLYTHLEAPGLCLGPEDVPDLAGEPRPDVGSETKGDRLHL